MATRLSHFFAATLLVAMVGCGNNQAGYKTPDEVFEASKTAVKKGDYKTFVNCMAPETVDDVASGMALGCVMLVSMADQPNLKLEDGMKSMIDVGNKHGLTAEAVKNMPKAGKDDEEKIKKSLLAPIKDKSAFVADMMASMPEKNRTAMLDELNSSTLKNVKIDGDKATATVVMKKAGKDVEEPANFRKVDGSWRIVTKMDKKSS